MKGFAVAAVVVAGFTVVGIVGVLAVCQGVESCALVVELLLPAGSSVTAHLVRVARCSLYLVSTSAVVIGAGSER